jgi:hypothetical protein
MKANLLSKKIRRIFIYKKHNGYANPPFYSVKCFDQTTDSSIITLAEKFLQTKGLYWQNKKIMDPLGQYKSSNSFWQDMHPAYFFSAINNNSCHISSVHIVVLDGEYIEE